MTMNNPSLTPQTTNAPQLPSFPALRERNLAALFDFGKDKSPKGCIDTKIAPLCHLINAHDEYVTTSSCSGRVALFDPGIADGDNEEERSGPKKSTKISGKGRGKWRLVTHDILPDLGVQLIDALGEAGRELAQQSATINDLNSSSSLLTLKYEPPLLHIAASSLVAGQKLLRLFKSVCRESGLVVTDERVTVEVRTMGTALCIPVFLTTSDSSGLKEQQAFQMSPSKQYLMSLAEMMNERMVQNETLLARLYKAIKEEMFCENEACSDDDMYEVEMHPLPALNLWKTAAVSLPCYNSNQVSNDLDVLAFGGQGVGPNSHTTCQRRDKIFRLKRRNGTWSDSWNDVKLSDEESLNHIRETGLKTSSGTFLVETVKSLGCREGHAACILPPMLSCDQPSAAVIFGGRTGGPLSPTNDVFLFTLQSDLEQNDNACGVLCKPLDIRGSPPIKRFGHSMTALRNCDHCNHLFDGETLALIAGGTGINSEGANEVLSSVYILSRCSNYHGTQHMLWEQLSDMSVPRCYHAAVRISLESCSNDVLVFGGVTRANDPFVGTNEDILTCCESNVLGCRSTFDLVSYKMFGLPPLVGGTSVELHNTSTTLLNQFLVIGGVQSCNQVPSTADSDKVLQIFQCDPDRKRVNSVKLSIKCIQNEGDSCQSNVCDLGVCAHHCLVSLPITCENKPNCVSSAVLVGGGVPSFSFGQSYAK